MCFGVSLLLLSDKPSVGLKDLLIDGLYVLRVGQDYIGQSHLDSQVCPLVTGILE